MEIQDVIAQARDTLTVKRVFGEPYEKDGVTIIPAARDIYADDNAIAGVAMLDLSWCGGLSEAKKIATMAEAHHLPIAPHDCTGPIVWAASCHLSLNAPNGLIQEMVRAFWTDWYRELVTGLPIVEMGQVRPSPGPGLGVALVPGLGQRPDAVVRRTTI